ncbi:MAG TPA: hypothetical protein VF746_21625 [Longimicrobium sp.]|jgi:hypothetical protein
MIVEADTLAAMIQAREAHRTATLALTGVGLTFLGTLAVAFWNGWNTWRIARLQGASQEQNTRLEAALAAQKSEQDARRDYEYEARKRLYKECEPLLFRLAEASESAFHRVYSLARTARLGHLGPPGGPSWLDGGYYLSSTIYNLLAPAAWFRLLQERLTGVDLAVDEKIEAQYLLAKRMYISFTDEFEFARLDHDLPYEPFDHDWKTKRISDPARYWRQGVTLGWLDVAVEALILREKDAPPRCLSFGEFQKAFEDDVPKHGGEKFGRFLEIFQYFHPRTRPVLWRMLVTQALLHKALYSMAQSRAATIGKVLSVGTVMVTELENFDWRPPEERNPESFKQVSEPFRVAQRYLTTHLPQSIAF